MMSASQCVVPVSCAVGRTTISAVCNIACRDAFKRCMDSGSNSRSGGCELGSAAVFHQNDGGFALGGWIVVSWRKSPVLGPWQAQAPREGEISIVLPVWQGGQMKRREQDKPDVFHLEHSSGKAKVGQAPACPDHMLPSIPQRSNSRRSVARVRGKNDCVSQASQAGLLGIPGRGMPHWRAA